MSEVIVSLYNKRSLDFARDDKLLIQISYHHLLHLHHGVHRILCFRWIRMEEDGSHIDRGDLSCDAIFIFTSTALRFLTTVSSQCISIFVYFVLISAGDRQGDTISEIELMIESAIHSDKLLVD